MTPALSISAGPPLDAEPGLGALTLPGFLREVTSAYPAREALVFHDDLSGEVVRWSYADLWERAVEVARALRGSGLGQGARVGVLMTNRPEWLAAVFGTALAGGVAVTLSTFSTPSELDHLLKVSGVSFLLFERRVQKTDFAAVLTELEPGIAGGGELRSTRFPFLRRLAVVGDAAPGVETWAEFLARGGDVPSALVDATAESVKPSDTAVVFFSSGTTSKPKGVLSAHRGVTVQMWRFRRMFGFGPQDTVRCWTANGFFWSGNFGQALGATLAAGGSLVLQRVFDADAALALMARERVTFPVAWPHQWAHLASARGWDDTDLSALVFVDRATPAARHRTVTADWSEPGRAYGNTETFTISTCYPANTPDEVHGGSSGLPLPGVTVKIVDPLTGAVVPRGEHGEICVKGPTLMLGYLGTPLDETLDADGFFPTGDGGRLDAEGRLFWEGRLTDLIKTGGANVSPLEVDEALAAHPSVKVAKTVGVPHDTLGEVVVACVVPQGPEPDTDELRAHLRTRLAAYKVPRHILYFTEDDLTLTGSNKIKSSDLRALAAARLG
ncbi:class I adenylate-forming enzyme family protein [Actinocorallia sp. A-T 12471]|uniref:class I adenylate-forming enzyme family protein n=1 Tax=Actinocorallia sp. A-T 12471 TaxID=3089813 RepID=UPI0029CAD414|nr:class I adenylate-forming enzyme family protein [Actinocorallia sp. A-T 12471]MDX6740812.1 class I adenylate-forming enzyme family protein [Actinocorallia sp. A-T 12471]